MNLKSLNEPDLVELLKMKVRTERKITSEIIAIIQEVFRRRIYLNYGVTSISAFLIQVIGYSKGAAQRRLDAAKLSNELPEIHEALKSGDLNLSHVSLLAYGIRQKENESSEKVSLSKKREILKKLKEVPADKGDVIVSQELDLILKQHDVCRKQKDESVRAEMTFTKEEQAEIERAKSLLSHQIKNPKHSELYLFLVRDLLKRKDPLKKNFDGKKHDGKRNDEKRLEQKKCEEQRGVEKRREENKSEAKIYEAKKRENLNPEIKVNSGTELESVRKKKGKRSYLSTRIDRRLHERDGSCRWKDPKTGEVCGSKYQLQRDHIVPIWAGGTNELENLQLLCATHNRLKYEIEVGKWTLSDQRDEYRREFEPKMRDLIFA